MMDVPEISGEKGEVRCEIKKESLKSFSRKTGRYPAGLRMN